MAICVICAICVTKEAEVFSSNTNYHELNTKAEGLASDSENEVAIIINGKLMGNYMAIIC